MPAGNELISNMAHFLERVGKREKLIKKEEVPWNYVQGVDFNSDLFV